MTIKENDRLSAIVSVTYHLQYIHLFARPSLALKQTICAKTVKEFFGDSCSREASPFAASAPRCFERMRPAAGAWRMMRSLERKP